eukprot:71640-Amphidinium_carterae.1
MPKEREAVRPQHEQYVQSIKMELCQSSGWEKELLHLCTVSWLACLAQRNPFDNMAEKMQQQPLSNMLVARVPLRPAAESASLTQANPTTETSLQRPPKKPSNTTRVQKLYRQLTHTKGYTTNPTN